MGSLQIYFKKELMGFADELICGVRERGGKERFKFGFREVGRTDLPSTKMRKVRSRWKSEISGSCRDM